MFTTLKRKAAVGIAILALVLAGASVWLWVGRNRLPFIHLGVVHQLPYQWDSYVRPDLTFTGEPIANVIEKVNAAIREASNNEVPEAIKLDTTPTRIEKVKSNATLDPHMDQLIAAFREQEKEMYQRGAMGFESARFTGTLDGHHSLDCMLVMTGAGGLDWEVEEDALHVYRVPRVMECRAYRIGEGLEALMERKRAANSLHVNCEPIVSALIHATEIHSWSIFVPNEPQGWRSEFRCDKVFRYIPELNVIIALATPKEHEEAERRLKASGLWVKRQSVDEGQSKPDTGNDS